jgi:hypothetical protein
MKRAMKLCVPLTLLIFSGCGGKTPELPQMKPCRTPYTEPADVNNTRCPHDEHFYTCVRVRIQKNIAAKKYEMEQRINNEGVCR